MPRNPLNLAAGLSTLLVQKAMTKLGLKIPTCTGHDMRGEIPLYIEVHRSMSSVASRLARFTTLNPFDNDFHEHARKETVILIHKEAIR